MEHIPTQLIDLTYRNLSINQYTSSLPYTFLFWSGVMPALVGERNSRGPGVIENLREDGEFFS